MKKLLLSVAILTGLTAFGQTYESKTIITAKGYKSEKHTITIKDKTVSFDGVNHNVTNIKKTEGAVKLTTYMIGENEFFTLLYKGKNVRQISYAKTVDGTTKVIVCFKPRLKK